MSAALVVAFLGVGFLVLSFALYSIDSRPWSRVGRLSSFFGIVGLACVAVGIIIAGAVIASALFHL
jgi:hypothetical protein